MPKNQHSHMNIELRTKEPVPESAKRSAIIIGGEEVGEVRPWMSGGKLIWHAIFRAQGIGVANTIIFQGHGYTPEAAVRAAIVRAREERDCFALRLAELEAKLGLAELSSEELGKDGAP